MCGLNEVAYATHPAHSVGRLCTTSRCGVVSQGDGIRWLFMHCAPNFIPRYGKPFPLLSSTTTALECINSLWHNHSSGMHKQFVAKKPFLLFSEKFVCKNEAFCIFGRHLSLLGKSHLLHESRWFFHGYKTRLGSVKVVCCYGNIHPLCCL